MLQSRKMKYLVLDTETTGLDHAKERIVEFAAVPINGLTPSIETYQQYFNPEIPMPLKAFSIHGLSNQFLSKYPTFKEKAKEIREYLEGKTLIIHNAKFDMNFLNAEFRKCNIPVLTNHVIDTLMFARRQYPGKRASLDALCSRLNISLAERGAKGHGALLDSQLLAQVYLKMITESTTNMLDNKISSITNTEFKTTIKVKVSEQEIKTKKEFIEKL